MVVWEGYPATCQLNLVNVAAEMLHICQEKPAHFISKLLRIIVSCSWCPVSVGLESTDIRIHHGRSWRSRNCVPSWRCLPWPLGNVYKSYKKMVEFSMDVHWLDHNVSQFDGYVWHMLSMLEHETLTALNTDTTNCWSLMVSLAPLLEARAKEGYCFPLNPVWPVLWLHRNVVWISWGKGVFDKVPRVLS